MYFDLLFNPILVINIDFKAVLLVHLQHDPNGIIADSFVQVSCYLFGILMFFLK